MKLNRRFFILVEIIVLSFLCVSCVQNESIKLKDWEIFYGSDIKQAQGPDAWEPIQIPSTFKVPHPKIKEYNYVWLRAKFDLGNASASDYYGITLGRVYHTDKLFMNEHPLDSLVPDVFNNIYMPRSYVLPEGSLKKENNYMYIKLGIYGNWYGGILDDVRLQPYKDYEQTQLINNILYFVFPFSIVFFLSIGFIAAGILFSWHRKEKLFLCAMITCAFHILYILSIFSPFNPFGNNISATIQAAFLPAMFIVGYMTVQAAHHIYFSQYNKIVIPVYVVITLLVIVNSELYSSSVIYVALMFIFAMVAGPFSFVLFYSLRKKKPDTLNSYILLLISASYGLVIVTETLINFAGMLFPRILVTYTLPFISLGFVILMARDAAQKALEMELLYAKLKIREDSAAIPGEHGASATNEAENGNMIPPSSEEKLKRIIAFIEENYSSDIGREGLADAVGMNPNYMGSLFKQYTGLKISQYINKIRIENSLHMIKDSDAKVLDIALTVGFESLSTFNRAFKTVMNLTPSEYRSQDLKSIDKHLTPT